MIELDKSLINKIFSEANHQLEYYLDLLRIAFGVDDVTSVDVIGKPKISKETYNFIFQKAINFDMVIHPYVMPGSLWRAGYFEMCDNVADWCIDMSNCVVLSNPKEGEILNAG